jgi:hypothetical protein
MEAKNNNQKESIQVLLKRLSAKSTEDDIKDVFSEIAGELLCNYHIVKGENTYDFLEIEFYFYSPNHRDLITYPRNGRKPGMWFFHMSGVDITFGTNDKEGDHPLMYGGILIRSIVKTQSDGSAMSEYICGPMKCVDELFDYIYAFDGDICRADIPYIEEKEEKEKISIGSCCRYIPLLFEEDRSQKISSKFKELKKRRIEKDWKNFRELIADWKSHEYDKDEFERFLERPYRFYRNVFDEWMKGYNAKPILDSI